MADKYKIMSNATSGMFDQHELDITGLSNGIDEYMSSTCIELLEYIGRNCICFDYDIFGQLQFQLKDDGHWITKQQLFENFL